MLGIHDLPLFIISGLLLNILPGPDSLLIMTRTAKQGWKAGSIAALGVGSGILVHIFAAAIGLSAILATSATAFTVIKFIGAAYLVYMGVSLLWQKKAKDVAPVDAISAVVTAQSFKKIFFQGFLTNTLNPKVALFFLAFVPQFIAPESEYKAQAFILLGFIFNFNGMLWCHFLVFVTAFASQRVRLSSRFTLWLNRTIGALFVWLGIRLALAER